MNGRVAEVTVVLAIEVVAYFAFTRSRGLSMTVKHLLGRVHVAIHRLEARDERHIGEDLDGAAVLIVTRGRADGTSVQCRILVEKSDACVDAAVILPR